MERLDRANQIYHLELIKSKFQQENADARSAAVCLIVIPVARIASIYGAHSVIFPVRAPWLLYTPRRARTLTPPQLATLRDTAAAPAIGDMQ